MLLLLQTLIPLHSSCILILLPLSEPDVMGQRHGGRDPRRLYRIPSPFIDGGIIPLKKHHLASTLFAWILEWSVDGLCLKSLFLVLPSAVRSRSFN